MPNRMNETPFSPESAPRRGAVSAVHGAVIDVRFDEGELPAIEEALIVEKDGGGEIYAEVQAHLDRSSITLQLRILTVSDSLSHHDLARGSWDGGSFDRDDAGVVGVVAA